MIVVIDNYDSFTYNLVHLLGRLRTDIRVFRNDETSIGNIRALNPDGILISPGPGRPENAGISVGIIRELGPQIPILGVCLGHQAIGYAFGASIVHAPSLMHGKTSLIKHDTSFLYQGVPDPFEAAFLQLHQSCRGASSCSQFFAVERLADVVVGARFQSLHNVLGPGARCQQDNVGGRGLILLPEPATDVHTCYSGHYPIQDCQARSFRLVQDFPRLGAISGDHDFISPSA